MNKTDELTIEDGGHRALDLFRAERTRRVEAEGLLDMMRRYFGKMLVPEIASRLDDYFAKYASPSTGEGG